MQMIRPKTNLRIFFLTSDLFLIKAAIFKNKFKKFQSMKPNLQKMQRTLSSETTIFWKR
jgi:hypothetical protein